MTTRLKKLLALRRNEAGGPNFSPANVARGYNAALCDAAEVFGECTAAEAKVLLAKLLREDDGRSLARLDENNRKRGET